MPLRACGHSAPTAKNRLATATPSAPLSSRATIDHVIGHYQRQKRYRSIERSIVTRRVSITSKHNTVRVCASFAVGGYVQRSPVPQFVGVNRRSLGGPSLARTSSCV